MIIPCTFLAYPFRSFRLLMVARLASFVTSMQDRSKSIVSLYDHDDDKKDEIEDTVPVLSGSNPMRKNQLQQPSSKELSKEDAKEDAKEAVKKVPPKNILPSITASISSAGLSSSWKIVQRSVRSRAHRQEQCIQEVDYPIPAQIEMSSSPSGLTAEPETNMERKLSLSAFKAASKKKSMSELHSSTPSSACLQVTACFTPAKHATSKHVTAIRGHIRWTNFYGGLVVALFVLVTIITHATSGKSSMYGCMAPSLRGAISYTVMISIILCVDGGFVIWLIVSGVQDNFHIKIELQLLLIAKLLFVVPYVVFDFLTMECPVALTAELPTLQPMTNASKLSVLSSTTCVWIPLSYWTLLMWVLSSYTMSIVVPLWHSLQSGERALRREDELESKTNKNIRKRNGQMMSSLTSLLKQKIGRETFFIFLKSEYSMENLLFYEACLHFKTKKFWNDPMEQFMAAHVIYEKFVKSNVAPFEVNLPAKVMKPLTALFETDDTAADEDVDDLIEVRDDIFDDAAANIFHLMESDSFSRFKRSAKGIELSHKDHKEFAWRKSLAEAHMA